MKSRKDLKAEYKQLKPVMGVYQIRNLKTHKVLIEGSTNIRSRFNRHKTELRFGSHKNIELQKDWNESTEENFEFKIISELEMKEEESTNYNKEVQLLEEMVLEELDLTDCQLY